MYKRQNLDRVQLYDLNSNLLADTDTLDLAQNIFLPRQDVEETSIDKSDESLSAKKSDATNQTKTFNTESYVKEYVLKKNFDNNIQIGVIDLPSFYMDFNAYMKRDPEYKSSSRDIKNILLEFNKKCD